MPEFASPMWLWGAAAALLYPLAQLFLTRRSSGLDAWRPASLLRGVALALLCVALAGPLAHTYNPHTDVVFAVDVSQSVSPEALDQSLDLIAQTLARKAPEQRIGVVTFGAAPVEQRALHARTGGPPDLRADVTTDGSDLQQAIEFAVGRFSTPAGGRVVLLSDGLQSSGSVADAARAAAGSGVEVVAIPLSTDPSDRLQLNALSGPDSAASGSPFRLSAQFWSAGARNAQFLLLRDGAELTAKRVAATRGAASIEFTDQLSEAGVYEYQVIASSPDDAVPDNNSARTFVTVRGPPRIALVAPEGAVPEALLNALRAQGMAVNTLSPAALPADLQALSAYALVVLSNTSAFDLSLAKMTALERYVRDAGGGVLVTGGPRSFSAGGYQSTPLESLLPVAMEIPAEVNIPSLVVAVLLDRSGSMSGTAGGREKLDIAKSAAFAAIEVLNPLDRIGVLAFDTEPEWVVPLTEAGRRLAIAARLAGLSAGGGTNLESALDEALRMLTEQTAKLKHVIVLSDGLSDTRETDESVFDDLTAALREAGITVSTVAFGADANQALMGRIAANGNGRFYHTDDPANVPRIFTSETVVISRGLIVEQAVQPVVSARGELAAILAAEAPPALDGYMRVHPKAAAQVLMATPDGDPLLAVWQNGLGRAAAFTSDLTPRWSARWQQWPRLPAFVAGLARWTMRHQSALTTRADFSWAQGSGRFTLDVLSEEGVFANGLDLTATVAPTRGEAAQLPLEQVAPGRYSTPFPARPGMRYFVTVGGLDAAAGARAANSRTFAAAAPVARERFGARADHRLLRRVAEQTGGTLLEADTRAVDTLLAPSTRATLGSAPVWWPWVSAALVILLLEVASRRLLLARTRRTSHADQGEHGSAAD